MRGIRVHVIFYDARDQFWPICYYIKYLVPNNKLVSGGAGIWLQNKPVVISSFTWEIREIKWPVSQKYPATGTSHSGGIVVSVSAHHTPTDKMIFFFLFIGKSNIPTNPYPCGAAHIAFHMIPSIKGGHSSCTSKSILFPDHQSLKIKLLCCTALGVNAMCQLIPLDFSVRNNPHIT